MGKFTSAEYKNSSLECTYKYHVTLSLCFDILRWRIGAEVRKVHFAEVTVRETCLSCLLYSTFSLCHFSVNTVDFEELKSYQILPLCYPVRVGMERNASSQDNGVPGRRPGVGGPFLRPTCCLLLLLGLSLMHEELNCWSTQVFVGFQEPSIGAYVLSLWKTLKSSENLMCFVYVVLNMDDRC
jgi:hypothetical protein